MIVRVFILLLIGFESIGQVANKKTADINPDSIRPVGKPRNNSVNKILPLRLMFGEKDMFQLRLYNYDGDHLLWKHEGEAQGQGELFMIDPQPYVAYGVRKFLLVVLDGDGKKIDEIYFHVDQDGAVIKE